jgi:hypothetical protein
METINLHVNGTLRDVRVDPDMPLLWVLSKVAPGEFGFQMEALASAPRFTSPHACSCCGSNGHNAIRRRGMPGHAERRTVREALLREGLPKGRA